MLDSLTTPIHLLGGGDGGGLADRGDAARLCLVWQKDVEQRQKPTRRGYTQSGREHSIIA